jgi:hypothetical protein
VSSVSRRARASASAAALGGVGQVEPAGERHELLGGGEHVVLHRAADLPVDRVDELERGMAAVEPHVRGRRRADNCFRHHYV